MSDVQLTLHIPQDHPSFAGHFPGQPIVPGVVLLDEVMQAIEQNGTSFSGGCEIPVCKFLLSVPPGATLTLLLSPQPQGGGSGFKLLQDGKTVATGSVRARAGT